MINIITAKEATAISNEELSVNQIRKYIFEGIYNQPYILKFNIDLNRYSLKKRSGSSLKLFMFGVFIFPSQESQL